MRIRPCNGPEIFPRPWIGLSFYRRRCFSAAASAAAITVLAAEPIPAPRSRASFGATDVAIALPAEDKNAAASPPRMPVKMITDAARRRSAK